MRRHLQLLAAVIASVAALSTLPAPAQAQNAHQKAEERIDPPVPRKADRPPVLWNYLVLIIIIGAVFGANMIPSKRGHQD